jgi:hypothetical protein
VIEQTTNDNHARRQVTPTPEPDAHGQAAMLLVESLLHGLIARSVIGVADAIEVVAVAAEVKEEVACHPFFYPAEPRERPHGPMRSRRELAGCCRSDVP